MIEKIILLSLALFMVAIALLLYRVVKGHLSQIVQ